MTATSRLDQIQQFKLKPDSNSKPHRSTIDSSIRFSNAVLEYPDKNNKEFHSQEDISELEVAIKRMNVTLKIVLAELVCYLNDKIAEL